MLLAGHGQSFATSLPLNTSQRIHETVAVLDRLERSLGPLLVAAREDHRRAFPAKAATVASPIPLLPPVTRATFPFISGTSAAGPTRRP